MDWIPTKIAPLFVALYVGLLLSCLLASNIIICIIDVFLQIPTSKWPAKDDISKRKIVVCGWLETTWWNSFFLWFSADCFAQFSPTTYFMYKSWTETFALHEQGYFPRQYCALLSFLAFLFVSMLVHRILLSVSSINSYSRDLRQFCKKKTKTWHTFKFWIHIVQTK